MATKRTMQKADRHLSTVTPGQVTAWEALDDETALALRDAVLAIVRGDESDVMSHAVLTVAAFYSGDVRRAARAAVSTSRRTVALAGMATDWDVYGDMTEEVETRFNLTDSRTTLSQYGTAPADRIASTTPGDVTDYAVALSGSVVLGTVVDHFRAHDAAACPDCHDGAGRRVSLTGVVAHMAGMTGTDAGYHSTRRATVAALATVDRERVLADLDGDPLADRPRKSSAATGSTPVTATPTPVLTVRTREGHVTVRNMTESESVALAMAGARPEHARHDGEEYGVSTAPERNDVTLSGMVRSHKPVVSPRAKSGGQTGPTVARFGSGPIVTR